MTFKEEMEGAAIIKRADIYEQIFFAAKTEAQKKWLDTREGGFMTGFEAGAKAALSSQLIKQVEEVLQAVIEDNEENWTIEQERLGNKGIVLPILKALTEARE